MFTYPFCYTPHPLIVEESKRLIERIDSSDELREAFKGGKMLGILLTDKGFLYGFSGLALGRSTLPGFVPPIFDFTAPDGWFRRREAEISVIGARQSELRRSMSADLQNWLFEQYKVLNALGHEKSIREIFADRGLVPPGGTGDCAAPKMLQYAYVHDMKPLAMGEFWYGAAPQREVRRQGCFYPSCTGKCGPLLTYMMEGLEVEPNPLEGDNMWSLPSPVVHFEDSYLVVVDKPSGMLAVPGRGARQSLEDWLSDYCHCKVYACHRLDMDTSGLMVFAKDSNTLSAIQRQFEDRQVKKSYLARLCAEGPQLEIGSEGTIQLPLALDYYDRPRQMVDYENGKMAVTKYKVLNTLADGSVDVLFTPLTGRTHQLRVHAAHSLGLGRPIIGDRLYGGCYAASPSSDNKKERRLMLHAASLSFRHPVSFERMNFKSDSNHQCG